MAISGGNAAMSTVASQNPKRVKRLLHVKCEPQLGISGEASFMTQTNSNTGAADRESVHARSFSRERFWLMILHGAAI